MSIESRMRAAESEIMNVHRETSGDTTFDSKVVTKWRQRRLNEQAFVGKNAYSAQEVAKDQEEIRQLERHAFTTEGKEATGLAYALMEGIQEQGWFGPDASVVFTSRYDDVKNGTDFAIRINREGKSPIFLAVDATTNPDLNALRTKLSMVIQKVKRGELTTLKYFGVPTEAEGDAEKVKRQRTMPRIVLGANPENAQKLVASFAKAYESGRLDEIRGGSLQHALLIELEEQLHYQLSVAAEAYDRQHNQGMPPPLVDGFERWEKSIADRKTDAPLTEADAQALIQAVQRPYRRTPAEDIPARNIYQLAETLVAIIHIRNEKGELHEQPADTEDPTVQVLTNPRRVA